MTHRRSCKYKASTLLLKVRGAPSYYLACNFRYARDALCKIVELTISKTNPDTCNDTTTQSSTLLPVEVVMQIFEAAAWGDPDLCSTLLLVSRTVYEWIDPIFHNARWLRSQRDLQAFEAFITRCPHTLVERNVTALAFAFDSVSGLLVQLLLGHLKGLRSLAITSGIELPETLPPFLTSFELIDADNSYWVARNGTEAILAAPQSFARLTHLRIEQLQQQFGLALASDTTLLPHLTHFAFSTIPPGSHIHAHVALRHTCVRILEGRDAIVILVACGQRPIPGYVDPHISIATIEDVRFVRLEDGWTMRERLLDWRVRALGGDGFWAIATAASAYASREGSIS